MPSTSRRRTSRWRDGFVYELILAHEHQHNETMLQLLQMVECYEPVRQDDGPASEPVADGPEMVRVEGGAVEIGAGPTATRTTTSARATRSSWIRSGSTGRPVTNGAFAQFVAETGTEAPKYWERDGEGGWTRTTMGRTEAVDPAQPVIHVDWHQADASPAGRPSACRPSSSGRRRRVAPTRSARTSTSSRSVAHRPEPTGRRRRLRRRPDAGDVWEWTASDFEGYPGFQAFPYAEYSEVFFGPEHKVLRGGAWATRRDVIRTTFRNWDLPQRSQIFSGLRCVRRNHEPTARANEAQVESPLTTAPSRSRSTSTCRARGPLRAGRGRAEGLSSPFKELPPKYFYDERGSELFEAITELPEYYPTRAERSILESRRGHRRRGRRRHPDRARLGLG